MEFKCGIVGLPNVGKSTLYNALTRASVATENYPFCTIDPNLGRVPVPDPRLEAIAAVVDPERTVAATMTFVDIAGLVAGASRGEGLGNRFLANIRESQAIAHVVRCFENDDVVHVGGRISAIDDAKTIETELLLADLEQIERAILKSARQSKSGHNEAKLHLELLERAHAHIAAGTPLRMVAMEPMERELLNTLQPLTLKPVLYVANVDEDGLGGNSQVDALRALAQQQEAGLVVISAAIEAEIATLALDEQHEFLAALQLRNLGLERLIQAGYTLLDLLTFFTAGPKEVRAWTAYSGVNARDAAGVIHSDFGKRFIRAEVIGYDDFIAYGGEQGAKSAGKWRLEGRDYRLQEGDIVNFRHNA